MNVPKATIALLGLKLLVLWALHQNQGQQQLPTVLYSLMAERHIAAPKSASKKMQHAFVTTMAALHCLELTKLTIAAAAKTDLYHQ